MSVLIIWPVLLTHRENCTDSLLRYLCRDDSRIAHFFIPGGGRAIHESPLHYGLIIHAGAMRDARAGWIYLSFQNIRAFSVSGFAAEGVDTVFDGALDFDGIGAESGDFGFAAL